MKIYWYWCIDDYVFKFPGQSGYWALSDSGKTWYAQRKTKNFKMALKEVRVSVEEKQNMTLDELIASKSSIKSSVGEWGLNNQQLISALLTCLEQRNTWIEEACGEESAETIADEDAELRVILESK